MAAGSVSKIAHTWPERETRFGRTFLHQMLMAKLIKCAVNPDEMLHVPELNRCQFNFRWRHSLVQRHGLAQALTLHSHLILQKHLKTSSCLGFHYSRVTELIPSWEMMVHLADEFNCVCWSRRNINPHWCFLKHPMNHIGCVG